MSLGKLRGIHLAGISVSELASTVEETPFKDMKSVGV